MFRFYIRGREILARDKANERSYSLGASASEFNAVSDYKDPPSDGHIRLRLPNRPKSHNGDSASVDALGKTFCGIELGAAAFGFSEFHGHMTVRLFYKPHIGNANINVGCKTR